MADKRPNLAPVSPSTDSIPGFMRKPIAAGWTTMGRRLSVKGTEMSKIRLESVGKRSYFRWLSELCPMNNAELAMELTMESIHWSAGSVASNFIGCLPAEIVLRYHRWTFYLAVDVIFYDVWTGYVRSLARWWFAKCSLPVWISRGASTPPSFAAFGRLIWLNSTAEMDGSADGMISRFD